MAVDPCDRCRGDTDKNIFANWGPDVLRSPWNPTNEEALEMLENTPPRHNPRSPQARNYVNHKGVACPVCASKNIDSTGSPEVGEWGVYQDVMCLDCSSEWQDIYVLHSYEMISDGNEEASFHE